MAEYDRKLFHVSYASLIGLCNKIRSFALRDIAEFTLYGIDQAYLDAYNEEINEFEVFPTDYVKHAEAGTKTQEKNKLRDELYTMVKAVAMRAKIAFEPNSTAGQSFAMGSISKLNDSKFLLETRRLKRDAEEYLAELSVFGLTQAMIDELDAKNTAFENALEAQAEAIADRREKTELRIKKGNALYEKMRLLCNIGQTIWYETDEARWNDYVLYTGAKYRRKDKPAEGDGE